MTEPPRVLITGFSVFPGAPVNPTEALVARLKKKPPALPGMAGFRAELLAVEYGSVGARLEEIAAAFAPDIAIHFGLALECTGFRLERLARNGIYASRADNAGVLPEQGCIMDGAGDLPSTLPLEAIAARLGAVGLPVSWSDDAGGYLCNYLFYLSCGPACPSFAPRMSGFVHVPPMREGDADPSNAMSLDDIEAGAGLIVESCVAEWLAASAGNAAA